MILAIPGWSDFQHYRNRTPPWIKLHRGLLDDMRWHGLPDPAKALLPLLWLLASESKDGRIEGSAEELAFRLRTTVERIERALPPLVAAGFLNAVQDASAESESESESERESETERTPEACASPAKEEEAEAKSMSAILFTQGLDWLKRSGGRPAPKCRAFLGKARAEVGDAALLAILENARRSGVIEPFAYIAKAVAAHKDATAPPAHGRDWN